jgi:16S rRNA (cytidine1402-2'-O)-methyltransferase
VAFHDHTSDGATKQFVDAIIAGKSVAYVSEAGTPLVADPGYELGRAVIEAGLPVTTAPGASAVLAALTVSGLPTDRFAFVGFLPAAKQQRETDIALLRDTPFTLVFYESPKRVSAMLASLRDVLGGQRQAVVCRELTKKFEETQRGTLDDLVAEFENRTVKGELVVLVGRVGATVVAEDDVETALRTAMKTMRVKDAATLVAGAMGLPRRQVYQTALGLGDDD